MDSKIRQSLVNKLASISATRQPVSIKRRGKPVATVLPVQDHKQFQAEQEERLTRVKAELNDILTFIRSRLPRQSPEEVQTKLAALREQIQQDIKDFDTPV